MTVAYAHGGDPDRVLSLLATWLGHSDAAHTYWYLTATGELMALAAGKLEPISEGEILMNALAISLQTYFTTFAHTQRDLSVNTIASYRDTWRMLLKYLTATTRDSRRRARLRRRHRDEHHRVPRPPRTRTWQQRQRPATSD